MQVVQNLVIDLGGVLYAIDPPRAVGRFLELIPNSLHGHSKSWIAEHQHIFDSLEAGLISPDAFRKYLRTEGGVIGSDAEIDAAWNSLLVGVIPGRPKDLTNLARHYRLILLSNTNVIHQQALKDECEELFAPFEQLFFSFEMGLRKPDQAIYLQALAKMEMNPSESLFIDDNLENVRGAQSAGLSVQHLTAHSDAEWDELVGRLLKGRV